MSENFTTSAFSMDNFTNMFGFIFACVLYFYKRTVICLLITQQSTWRNRYLVQQFVKVIEFIASFNIIRTFWIINLYIVCLGKIITRYFHEIFALIQDHCANVHMNEVVLQRDGNEISLGIPEVIHSMNYVVGENEFGQRSIIDEPDETLVQKLELHNFLKLEDCAFIDSNIHAGSLEVCNIASEVGNKSNLYTESLCPGLAIGDKNRDYFHRTSTVRLEQENKAHRANELDTNVLVQEQEQINPLEIIKANEITKFSREVAASPSDMGPPKVCNASEGIESDKDKIEPFSEFQYRPINYNNNCKALIELCEISPNKNESKITVKEQTLDFKQCKLIQKENQFGACDTQNIEDKLKNIIHKFVHSSEPASTKEELNMLIKNRVAGKRIQELEHCLPKQNDILLKQSNVLQNKYILKEKFADRPLKTHNLIATIHYKENSSMETKPISTSKSSFESSTTVVGPATKHSLNADLVSDMPTNGCETYSECTAKPSIPIDEDNRIQYSRFNDNVEDVVNRIDLRFIYALS